MKIGPFHILLLSTTLAGCSMLEERLGGVNPVSVVSAGADAYKAATLSDEDTIQMASKVAAEMDRNNQIAAPGSVYATRLKKLTSGLENEDGLKLNFKVYIDPEVNAFSLADGTVRVHSGMMDRMNDEQVMFVIGHEIGHIKSGHSKSRLQRAYAASAVGGAASSYVQSAAGASVGGVAAVIGSEVLADLATEVVTAQFSQSDEIESDDYGVYFLARHGKRPEAALEALRAIDQDAEADDKGMLAQFVSTHPGGQERIESVTLVLASMNTTGAGRGSQVAAARQGSNVKVENRAERSAPAVRTASLKGAPAKSVTLKAPPLQPKLPAPSAPATAAGWYIQLAAFPDAAPAESMKGALRERSERVMLQTTVVKGNMYERVLVGPYPTRQNAAIELDRVVSHGIFEGEPFIRRLPD